MTMERFDAYLAVIAHTVYVVILAQTDCAAITFALPNLFYGESAHVIPIHSNPIYTQEAVYVPEN